jgi:hypothetical protein
MASLETDKLSHSEIPLGHKLLDLFLSPNSRNSIQRICLGDDRDCGLNARPGGVDQIRGPAPELRPARFSPGIRGKLCGGILL